MQYKAIQDYYAEPLAVCYGCGRLNEHGLQIKSYWDGDETICVFRPLPQHTAIKGFVYGGLIASLIDCHCTGTAAAALYRAAGLAMDDPQTSFRCVTASLHVDYLAPTPLGVDLTLRARPVEIKGRKVIVECELSARGKVTATGRVVAVNVPEGFGQSE